MKSEMLFEAALSIKEPWYIKDIKFDVNLKRLDIYIDFKRGSLFKSANPDHADEYKAYDTIEKTWRHLNFFEHECYLHCRTPRIKPDDTKIELISPPWAGKNTGFTLLFEAMVVEMCRYMPIHTVCKLINETDNKIWRLLGKYIDEVRELEDFSEIKAIGLDETSRAKGHEYVTLFVDLKERRTLFVTDGKDSQTVKKFVEDLKSHNGDPNKIEDVSCDMSKAFIKGVGEYLPKAKITFDKFHILKLINKAVDTVRKEEVKDQPILKKSKYVLLKNNNNLTKKQLTRLEELSLPKYNLKSIRALHIRENFRPVRTIIS